LEFHGNTRDVEGGGALSAGDPLSGSLGSQTDLRHEIFLGLFNEGVLIDPGGVGNISTVIGQEEIGRLGTAIRAVLERIKPL
jgi:hypothetical protein